MHKRTALTAWRVSIPVTVSIYSRMYLWQTWVVTMATTSGTSFIDISDPLNPVYVGNLPSHSGSSTWRDIKVHKDYAFIVSEAGGHGMQVFDLTELDAVTAPPVTFSETVHFEDTGIGGLVGGSHNIVINEASEFAYLVGTDLCGGGLVVYARCPMCQLYRTGCRLCRHRDLLQFQRLDRLCYRKCYRQIGHAIDSFESVYR